MDKRIIAIDFLHASVQELVHSLVKRFCGSTDKYDIVVFKDSSLEFSIDGVLSIDFPDTADNISKRKNFILEYAEKNNFKGFLHIIEDTVAIDKDPLDYILAVEHTMDIFDYSIYFSTVTDPCNYIFKKFNPRLTLDIDDDDIKSKLNLPNSISFTSHSNTCWLIYDFNKLNGNILKFNEQFSIAMYAIIEYLARRRATKMQGLLYYMNQYLSISNEIGTYHSVSIDGKLIDPKTMQAEDAIFRAMDVDFVPDNNIDTVLDDFYLKMTQKMA